MPRVETNAAAQKIKIVRSFFERLDDFKKQEEQSLPLLGRFLERLEVKLPKLQDEEKSWRRATAPNFNVFRVLHLERRETKLHSRFLAELLDPKGIHDQGDRFLTAFLELLENVRLHRPAEWRPDWVWKIRTEEVIRPAQVGDTRSAISELYRLDIVLRCEQGKFIMVIENKVDAAESDNQLFHYEEWLQKQRRFDFRNLVFLTPDGREPETISKDKCLCLSYREHVTEWLRNMANEIKPQRDLSHLHFAIDQYLQLLDSL